MNRTSPFRPERLLDGFEPDFEFVPPPPLPESEFVARLRRIRREATVAGHDALLIHAGPLGWYHTSNSYLRYVCDWMREGVLILPTDADEPAHLLSFYSDSVVLPPAGEPMLVDHIWQVAPWGREGLDRPGSSLRRLVEACTTRLRDMGLSRAQLGVIGDDSSGSIWRQLAVEVPHAHLLPDNAIIDRMQRNRSTAEQGLIRAAAQLIDIGYQAACHVARPGVTDTEIYAAFTFAQLARGGETGDGYQIGVNEFGTHCGKPYGRVVRPGDLINLYVSNVTYMGYFAQTARMIAVGDITDKQEETLAMCVDAVRRAEAEIGLGVEFSELHDAAFRAYTERGYLEDTATRTMPFNWAAMPDGSAREIPRSYVPDKDWEAQGRMLSHVYPPVAGPHNPNLGHAVGMPKMPLFNIASHNHDLIEEGMAFVLHAQWLDPLEAGANVGDCYVITPDGPENVSCHTSIEPFRVR